MLFGLVPLWTRELFLLFHWQLKRVQVVFSVVGHLSLNSKSLLHVFIDLRNALLQHACCHY